MEIYKKYCLLNEIDSNRINLPKDISKTELQENEAQFFISSGNLHLERAHSNLDLIRLNFFTSFTSQVLKFYSLNNLNFKFILDLKDGPEPNLTETRFCFARSRNSPNICIPDPHLPRVIKICQQLEKIDKPFLEKQNKICFFGSDTGKKFPDGIAQRVKLCQKFKNHKDIVSKITNFVGHEFDASIYCDPVSIQDQLDYRYILNVNGNTTSWERLIWAMNSNSFCLFLRPPPHQDEVSWYYHMFELSQFFITLDENSLENFLDWSIDWQSEIEAFSQHQKDVSKSLAKIDFHAHYYAQVLLNYNHIYNEQIK